MMNDPIGGRDPTRPMPAAFTKLPKVGLAGPVMKSRMTKAPQQPIAPSVPQPSKGLLPTAVAKPVQPVAQPTPVMRQPLQTGDVGGFKVGPAPAMTTGPVTPDMLR